MSEQSDIYPEHLSQTWALPSGEVLLLRPVRHDDAEREENFVRGLSSESGFQRMMSGSFRITPEWLEQMTHIDYHRHMAFAVTTVKDGVEQFLGVGRYVLDTTQTTAEFALVVADARQGQGLGRRLLQALIEHAQAAGIREMEGYVLATNRSMLALARTLGFTVRTDTGDATLVRVRRDL